MALSSPPSSPPLSDTPSSPGISVSNKQVSALDKVQALLQQLLRITAIDGRIFVGTFAGTDKPLNIILINAEEYRMGPDHDADGRYVGQVMLPWKYVVKVEAHLPDQKPYGSSESIYMWWEPSNIAHTVTPSFVGPALTIVDDHDAPSHGSRNITIDTHEGYPWETGHATFKQNDNRNDFGF